MPTIPASARTALNSLAFAIGLASSCHGIHRLLPDPAIAEITPKLEHLRASAGRYDTLFVGTSRTYHQVIPAQFDRIAGTRSFNAAANGLFPPEDSYYLERIAETGAHFRYVFLELNPSRLRIDEAKRGTERVVYWHDAPRLGLLLREAWVLFAAPNLSLPQRWDVLEMAAERVGLFARGQSNLGRAQFIQRHLQPPSKPRPPDLSALGQNGDGYLEADYPPLSGAARTAYERTVAASTANPEAKTYGSDASQAALQRLIQTAKTLGEPILIRPPTLPPRKFMPRDQTLRLLDFADPARFPELFRPEQRLDAEHLNPAGARVYTEVLAKEFARHGEPQGGAGDR